MEKMERVSERGPDESIEGLFLLHKDWFPVTLALLPVTASQSQTSALPAPVGTALCLAFPVFLMSVWGCDVAGGDACEFSEGKRDCRLALGPPRPPETRVASSFAF